MPGRGGRWRPVIGLVGVLALVLTIVANPSSARQQPISTVQGHAQIIAQGIASLPAPEAAWRVAYHTIEPGGPADLPADLQFLLVDQGTLLTASGDDRRLLGAGEAAFLPESDERLGTAFDARPAGFYSLDLVPPDAVADTGDGLPIFAGDAFAAPSGERDLKLVRDVLAPEEETVIAAGPDAPLVILATLGTITAEADPEEGPVELRVGEVETFTGEVTVRGEGLAPASFVAAVIGREVSEAPAAGTPVASPVAESSGTVAVRLHACPVGMRPGESNTNLCPPDFNAVDLRLVEVLPGGVERDLGAPAAAESELQWTDLAPGDYVLRATGFGPGFDRFFVAGLAGTTGTTGSAGEGYPAGPEGGYRIPVTAGGASFRLDVYAFTSANEVARGTPVVRTTAVAVRQEPTGAVGVRVFACPTVGLFSFDAAACADAVAPYDVSLAGGEQQVTLTLAEASADASGYQTWDDLEPGTYVVQVPLMPAGTVAYFVVESADVTLLPDSTGYAVNVTESDEPLLIDIYAVGPEPVPPTAVATVAATMAPTVEAAAIDNDGDGLTDEAEANIHGTDPTIWDTDGDGIGDGEEIQTGTDPFTPNAAAGGPLDSDSDGLPDADEAGAGTDPFVADTDSDGWLDGNEMLLGSDPLNSNSFPASP